MTNPADSIEIQNVVASTGIGQELDLEALAEDLPGADFNPDNFPGLVYRTQEPKAAALIFRSGKIVCTGAKSIDDVHEALGIIFEKLRGLRIPVEKTPRSRSRTSSRARTSATTSISTRSRSDSDSKTLSTSRNSSLGWSTGWTSPRS
jgi:TATA binding protein of transcription factor TFIID